MIESEMGSKMGDSDRTDKKLDDLLNEDYSVQTLIQQAQENNLSLSELRDRLLRRQHDLNQLSIDLFNNNYDRFFKLSQHITGLNEPIENVLRPIELYHDRLTDLCKKHDDYLAKIDNNISSLENTSKNKLLAEVLLKLIERRKKIFEQVNHLEWIRQPSVEILVKEYDENKLEHRINLNHIERLTIGLHLLHCEIRAVEPTHDELIPIKESLEMSVSVRKSQLTLWFKEIFHEAMSTKKKALVEFVLDTYKHVSDDYFDLDVDKYFGERTQESLARIDGFIKEQPLSEMKTHPSDKQFKIKICHHIYDEITRCWCTESYIPALDRNHMSMASEILKKFAAWLGKLRLSDFKIVGTQINIDGSGGGSTNFLAKQDAIMRLFIEDCTRLMERITEYQLKTLPELDPKSMNLRRSILDRSIEIVEEGMTNVRNLQKLLER